MLDSLVFHNYTLVYFIKNFTLRTPNTTTTTTTT